MIIYILIEKLSFVIIIFLIVFIPAISFADAETIFKENIKSVVVVVTFDNQGNPLNQGSGFIVRSDGALVTNYHVINNAKSIKIKTGGRALDVEGIIHIDKENDLVLLKAKGENLQIVQLGDIKKVSVGEKIYVISSPQGLENTISEGILSGIRKIEPKREFLQITAPISEGSSGGPVFNENGEVIGIATFLIKEAQNLNFAMPVNLIKDKISNKKVTALKESDIKDITKDAEFLFILGALSISLEMHKEAISFFKMVIKTKPDHAGAYLMLGMTYSSAGLLHEAIEPLKKAKQLDMSLAQASYMSLGWVYKDLERYIDALEAFKQAALIEPDDEWANLGLCYMYSNLKKYGDTVKACEKSVNSKYAADAYFNLGEAYSKLELFRNALESYKQLLKLHPNSPRGNFLIAALYCILLDHPDPKIRALGSRRKAQEHYQIMKKNAPDIASQNYFNNCQ